MLKTTCFACGHPSRADRRRPLLRTARSHRTPLFAATQRGVHGPQGQQGGAVNLVSSAVAHSFADSLRGRELFRWAVPPHIFGFPWTSTSQRLASFVAELNHSHAAVHPIANAAADAETRGKQRARPPPHPRAPLAGVTARLPPTRLKHEMGCTHSTAVAAPRTSRGPIACEVGDCARWPAGGAATIAGCTAASSMSVTAQSLDALGGGSRRLSTSRLGVRSSSAARGVDAASPRAHIVAAQATVGGGERSAPDMCQSAPPSTTTTAARSFSVGPGPQRQQRGAACRPHRAL